MRRSIPSSASKRFIRRSARSGPSTFAILTRALFLSPGDEKTSIQALERSQLPLPLRQGRAARHTHDYKRHGVLDLYAALNVATGEVAHACTDSHTAADFLGFIKLVAGQNPRRELHVVLDDSSTHSTPAVMAWLKKNPRIHFHYTPTSGSWLNQVEGFFGILAKQSLRATDFLSKKQLRDHIAAYIKHWNAEPTPFIWTKPRCGHHPKSQANACAYLISGALGGRKHVSR